MMLAFLVILPVRSFANETVTTEQKFEEKKPIGENLYKYKSNGKWGLMDSEEKMITEPQYYNIYTYKNGLIKILLNSTNKFGYMDKNGKELLDPSKYDRIYPFKDGLAKYELLKNGQEQSRRLKAIN